MKDQIPASIGPELVIFTDLDGTLLDHHTYSWQVARPALEGCEARGIPVILCSSKTRAEIEHIRKEMGNRHPFISENGGGVYIPASSFPEMDFYGAEGAPAVHEDGRGSRGALLWVLKLGIPIEILRGALAEIRDETGVDIAGFSDMDNEELAGLTGLGGDELARARLREFDEPFTIRGDSPGKASRVREAVEKRGYIYTRGGRFHHITGNNDKGRALQRIMQLYRESDELVKSAALGDSLNDLSMLQAANIPILVRKPDGTHDPNVRLPGLLRAEGIGPHGWNEEIMQLLRQISSK